MNFAVHLALSSEVASLYTPLCAPTDASALGPHLSERYDPRNMHHASALLSAHVETVTLPMRVRASSSDSTAGAPTRDSAAALIARLNWKRDTPIAALSGCFPTPLLAAAVAKPAIMDPIDALLAARGYAPKQPQQHSRERGSRETPQEIAQRAAGVLKAAWSDLSCARGILDPRAKPAPSFSAFGRALVARDGDTHAREITLQALEALLASSSPRPPPTRRPRRSSRRWPSRCPTRSRSSSAGLRARAARSSSSASTRPPSSRARRAACRSSLRSAPPPRPPTPCSSAPRRPSRRHWRATRR